MSVDNANADIVQHLRAELKLWEKTFAQSHDGRKPTRDEIKRDAAIAEKYRRFNRLNRPEQTTQPTFTTPRKSAYGRSQQREVLAEQTTNLISVRAAQQQEIEPTPAHIRCALGPTPQKDGFVLGIFDLFEGSATPSKGDETKHMSIEQPIQGTPSRSLFPPAFSTQHSKTPQSSSKRFYLDAFAGTTPKRKREDDMGTPASVKRQFATPSFLRRDLMFDAIPEEHDGDTEDLPSLTNKKPGRRKGMARSFSSILAGLRKNEDERMDEEWEILKELEAEQQTESSTARPPLKCATPAEVVLDSQVVDMPLGPDEAPLSDTSEPDTGPAVRKPWKKKGLKRQTKKSNMKPVLHAPQKAVIPESQAVDEDGVVVEVALTAASNDAAKPAEGLVRKTVRKVNEAAHMNFRRLKIKNKNTKANGRPGRFGRR
ncbi:hypothetical protein AMS68_000952 [Peltaster fructicola]|uniref:DNA replication regulator SLD2 n=1 Tax=Peltaster fructicola TaxID=286661 RepID=A0A6H0XLD1_9PEZI|nr:hypothetical protein AMS68_000952 [Peltaster fructicola]